MVHYLIWLVYTITTGSLAVGVTSLLCIRGGLGAYWGIFFAAAYALLVAGGIALLCRIISGITLFVNKNRSLFVVLEAILAVTFIVIGVLFRIEGVEKASGGEIYYDMAKTATGQEIPQVVHGAVYLYLQLLRAGFTLFGDQFVVGIWIQIVLQMIALTVLFFVVRKLTGSVTALVTLGFGMCAPYMVRNALILSPEMLYFCLLAVAVGVMTAGDTNRKPGWFLGMGGLIAVYGYLDVIGLLLLIPAFWMIFWCQEEKTSKKAAVGCCMGGLCLGFMGCVLLDALLSGDSLWKVGKAWFLLYRPQEFRIPVAVEGVASDLEGIVLLGIMFFGIFSFWRDMEKEQMSVCVLAAGAIILVGSYGIFTNEMPGSFSLYVLFTVLAGIGVGQCFYMVPPLQEAEHRKVEEIFDDVPGEDETELRADCVTESMVAESPLKSAAKDNLETIVAESAQKPATKEKAKSMAKAVSKPETMIKDEDMPEQKRMEEEHSIKKGVSQHMIKIKHVPEQMKVEEKYSRAKDVPKPVRENKPEPIMKSSVEKAETSIKDLQKESDTAGEILQDTADYKVVKYIENPLPPPKKHTRQVMEYAREVVSSEEDYDHVIAVDDDFDI